MINIVNKGLTVLPKGIAINNFNFKFPVIEKPLIGSHAYIK